MTTIRKKLIEVSMPLEAINVASAREKSVRHGHPSTLHLWWARRPLAACRAVLFGQLVDDPSAWPDRFRTEEAQAAERERLHGVIAEFVEWPKSTSADQARWERALDAGRYEIARSVAWARGEEPPTNRAEVLAYLAEHAPPVYDPFCGGGSIPLEAQRLGLRAYGSDLNPVAVLISKALVEIPPKFAGMGPVNAEASEDLVSRQWRGAEGLAADVRYYGAWMRAEAHRRIGHFYPDAILPDGRKATVIAWLWARTVRSPDPAAKGAMVPLASSFILSSKAGKEAIVHLVRDAAAPDGWRFEVQRDGVTAAELSAARNGTKSAKAAAFVCGLTGSPIERTYIQVEGKNDRLGARLMAIVAEGDRCRVYLPPDAASEATALSASQSPLPNECRTGVLSGSTPTRAMITGGVCSAYGLRTWGHLFTDRQLVALDTFSDLVAEARENALEDARAAFATRKLPLDTLSLAEGGHGPGAYADAVATYLAFAVDRATDAWSSIATWANGGEFIRNTFARQAIPMTWDFVECNPFSRSTGNIAGVFEWIEKVLEFSRYETAGHVRQADATTFSVTEPVMISTDPPYYDNIGYADLSDYFYVWLRRNAGPIWPSLFRRVQTPKTEELVATPYRHGGRSGAEDFFMAGMKKALSAVREAGADAPPMTIYYAFKQSETSDDGVTSAGWASFLQAVVDSRIVVDGTWPIRTERGARTIAAEANVLASSVVLVCRPREPDAPTTTLREFVAELRRELPGAIAKIKASGLHPVDMPQAAIGPGMAVFSKYAMVREPADNAMSVSKAIALINQVRGEAEHVDAGDLDAPTRFALDWFASYGWREKSAGEAIKLAQSYDLAERQLREAGVLVTDHGEARLAQRREIAEGRRDRVGSCAWSFAQAMNHALNAGGGVGQAAVLLAQAQGLGGDVRWLIGRLFTIAEDRRMTEEAIGWGRLSEEWGAIEAAADKIGETVTAPAQAELF